MRNIKTSKGLLGYRNLLPSNEQKLNETTAIENLKRIKACLDRTGIGWGPAFGTLIGIVRNDGFLPWATSLDFYILKEDEERFKDALWKLKDEGFELVRYERRGLYCLVRNGGWMTFYIMRKISPDIRHSGGTHFLFDHYLRDTVKWDFKGIELKVPADLDEYLTFQYGDWMSPVKTGGGLFGKANNFMERLKVRIKDNLPNSLYFPLIQKYHQKDFDRFKEKCKINGLHISDDIELSYLKPRKNKKVLTVGVYDLIHKGHVELFRRAKGLGDYLIVAVQDSDFILKYKPQAKVLNSTADRMYLVQSIRWVDEVIVYEDVDEIVKNVDFDLFVSGPDQIHSGFQRAIKWCEENGKEFMILGRTEGVSSSELKEKIANKERKK